jgi:hypothetical protein
VKLSLEQDEVVADSTNKYGGTVEQQDTAIDGSSARVRSDREAAKIATFLDVRPDISPLLTHTPPPV